MMKKILYIPLDERPCNLDFINLLSKGTEYDITIPYEKINGNKKTPSDVVGMWKWIFSNINNFDAAILSIDMLLYGGIVPSRIHNYSIEECHVGIENLKKLKKLNKNLKIYAFNLIMRCPSYSSGDEEPDYYEQYGKEIFELGKLHHKSTLNLLNKEELNTLSELRAYIPEDIINDYISRRSINLNVNKEIIELLKDDTLDFLVIPQDDSAPFGFTAVDQSELRDYIYNNKLVFKAYMYPGADEVALTIFARIINEDKGYTPKFYTRYSSTKGPFITPLYEDRIINETLKYHILCAGGMLTDSLDNCDIVLMINSPSETMYEAWEQHEPKINNSNRNLVEYVEFIDYVINTKNFTCGIADIAYSNGGDLQLIDHLSTKGLLYKVASYAGWNTNANTLGTSICQSVIYKYYGKTTSHIDFLSLRYVEDGGYCSYVRQYITKNILLAKNLNYFKVDGVEGDISKIVMKELQRFADERLIDDEYSINLTKCFMPWNRMFETGIILKTIKKNKAGL